MVLVPIELPVFNLAKVRKIFAFGSEFLAPCLLTLVFCCYFASGGNGSAIHGDHGMSVYSFASLLFWLASSAIICAVMSPWFFCVFGLAVERDHFMELSSVTKFKLATFKARIPFELSISVFLDMWPCPGSILPRLGREFCTGNQSVSAWLTVSVLPLPIPSRMGLYLFVWYFRSDGSLYRFVYLGHLHRRVLG